MGALSFLNGPGQVAATGGVVDDSSIPASIARDAEVNNSTVTISAGGGLATGGSFTTNQGSNSTVTLAHSDTSSQASVNNSGTTVIQDITLDTYGHVTAIGSATISTGGGNNNTSTTAVGAYAMVGATNPTNTNVGTGTSFSGNTSVYQYGGITGGTNNFSLDLVNPTIARNGNLPSGTWFFRGAGGQNTARATLCQRTA